MIPARDDAAESMGERVPLDDDVGLHSETFAGDGVPFGDPPQGPSRLALMTAVPTLVEKYRSPIERRSGQL